MRKLFLAFTLLLTACSSTQLAQTQTTLAQGQLVIDQGACAAQKAANEATAVLTAAGDTAGAAKTAQVSTVAGAACMTLAPVATSAS